MPSSANLSTSTSGTPGQPTHAPLCERRNGASALTSPPGLCFHRSVPSGSCSRSTGSRLATTMKSAPPLRCRTCLGRALGRSSVVVTPDVPPSEPRSNLDISQRLSGMGDEKCPRHNGRSVTVRARAAARPVEAAPRGPQRARHPRPGQPPFEPAEAVADGLGEVLPQHHARGERERRPTRRASAWTAAASARSTASSYSAAVGGQAGQQRHHPGHGDDQRRDPQPAGDQAAGEADHGGGDRGRGDRARPRRASARCSRPRPRAPATPATSTARGVA